MDDRSHICHGPAINARLLERRSCTRGPAGQARELQHFRCVAVAVSACPTARWAGRGRARRSRYQRDRRSTRDTQHRFSVMVASSEEVSGVQREPALSAMAAVSPAAMAPNTAACSTQLGTRTRARRTARRTRRVRRHLRRAMRGKAGGRGACAIMSHPSSEQPRRMRENEGAGQNSCDLGSTPFPRTDPGRAAAARCSRRSRVTGQNAARSAVSF